MPEVSEYEAGYRAGDQDNWWSWLLAGFLGTLLVLACVVLAFFLSIWMGPTNGGS